MSKGRTISFFSGQAAALFRDDITVMKAYILAAAQALNKMKEAGVLWDDPLVSVLNLCGIEASTRRGAMREFTQRREQDALARLRAGDDTAGIANPFSGPAEGAPAQSAGPAGSTDF